jgi:hypothetical protein
MDEALIQSVQISLDNHYLAPERLVNVPDHLGGEESVQTLQEIILLLR